ncbi:MAG: phytanoyl-CoA dioxygenase family protein [Abditibacteriales bacterium]|nr:phytanoyl-CoA dioxygenase family protein [Abditibacteriales bacterium]MDW8366412.1 phytanoyl-CoA dioxygenase family protein [Abditibacteriales bacterium]
MTDQERYLFDLQGFIVVPNALSAEEVAELNAIMDEHIAQECPVDMRTHRFVGLLHWGKAYRRLIDHPHIVPYLEEMLGPQFRLDHDYADVIRAGKGPIGTTLHGGATPFNPVFYHHVYNGRMFNGLVAVAFNLKDVNPGDGGFAAVPGSHKSHFPFPPEWKELDTDHLPPCIQRVTGPAGTAIIFTEALTHGTLPWRGKQERRTVFYKYSPHPLSWAARYYCADDYPDLTERQRAILEPPNARYPGRPHY